MPNIALGSRPKNDFEKKLVGIVKVVSGKTKAKLTLTEDGKLFKNGTDSITVDLDDLPKRPKIQPDDKTGKEYRVRMNQDGDGVEALTPVRGHHPAKLVDIGPHKEGEDPYPIEKTFTKGETENSHLEFFAAYEITSGPFKGVQTPGYWLHYKFEEDPENEGYTRFAGNFENKKATRLFQVRDWGNAHGLWEEAIEWDDYSILPVLLERALDNDREVELTFDGGYIKLVQAKDDYEEPEDIEDVQDKIHSAGKKVVDEIDKEFPLVSKNGGKVGTTYTTKASKKLIKSNKVKQSVEDDDL